MNLIGQSSRIAYTGYQGGFRNLLVKASYLSRSVSSINQGDKPGAIKNISKHSKPRNNIAKRPLEEWPDYGKEGVWNKEFNNAVRLGVTGINKHRWNARQVICFFEKYRSDIERKRRNNDYPLFGSRRDNDENYRSLIQTRLALQSYRYALERAVAIPYDENNFVQSRSKIGQLWEEAFFRPLNGKGPIRWGLVVGKAGENKINLTQYAFSATNQLANDRWFGGDDCYVGKNNESAIWIHPHRDEIQQGYEHCCNLLEIALKGDLSFVPKFHWWYVHLAPVLRGPGGIAEMVSATVHNLHNSNLPGWKTGIAPSVEILLEPDEDKFCKSYSSLLENYDQE